MDTINGTIWARDVDGDTICFSPEALLSAKPNTNVIGEDYGHPITLVWLKGHRRHTALRCSMSELAAALEGNDAGPGLAWHVNEKHLRDFEQYQKSRCNCGPNEACSRCPDPK